MKMRPFLLIDAAEISWDFSFTSKLDKLAEFSSWQNEWRGNFTDNGADG